MPIEGSSEKWMRLLRDPRVQYALAGAGVGVAGSLARSVAQDRPVRSTAGNAVLGGALGALVGAGGHSLASSAGFIPPPLTRGAVSPFSNLTPKYSALMRKRASIVRALRGWRGAHAKAAASAEERAARLDDFLSLADTFYDGVKSVPSERWEALPQDKKDLYSRVWRSAKDRTKPYNVTTRGKTVDYSPIFGGDPGHVKLRNDMRHYPLSEYNTGLSQLIRGEDGRLLFERKFDSGRRDRVNRRIRDIISTEKPEWMARLHNLDADDLQTAIHDIVGGKEPYIPTATPEELELWKQRAAKLNPGGFITLPHPGKDFRDSTKHINFAKRPLAYNPVGPSTKNMRIRLAKLFVRKNKLGVALSLLGLGGLGALTGGALNRSSKPTSKRAVLSIPSRA